jgi:chromosome segregation ATPase
MARATARVGEQEAELRAAMDIAAAQTRAELASTLDAGRAQLARAAGEAEAQRNELLSQVEAQVARARGELVTALDAARADVASLLDASRAELAAGAARLEEGQAAVAAEMARATAADQAQAELVATVAALRRGADRAQDRTRKLSERVEELAAAVDRAGSAESAALAPLRSDVRMLLAQVGELAEALAAAPSLSGRKAAPADTAPVKITAAEKARAVSARKATIPAKSRSAARTAPRPSPAPRRTVQ